MMPVTAVPRQAAHFNAENDAHMTKRDFRKQSLKPFSPLQALAADAQVVVHDFNLLARPAISPCSVDQVVLQLCRFDVFSHLPRTGLTHVDDRYPREMPRRDFTAADKRPSGHIQFGTGVCPRSGHASPPRPGASHEPLESAWPSSALPGGPPPEDAATTPLA